MTLNVSSDSSYVIITDLTVGSTYRVIIGAVTMVGIGPVTTVTEPGAGM